MMFGERDPGSGRQGRGATVSPSLGHSLRRYLLLLLLVFPASLVPLSASVAQDPRIRAQRDTLDKIRQERADLERRAVELQSTVHDLNEEVANLDQRAAATARLVQALDAQLSTITRAVDSTSSKVTRAERELTQKKTALHDRLVAIYKRGPLYSTEAMLSARSFGELIARYKYLHLLAMHDRSLVTRVEDLRNQVARDHANLVSLQSSLEDNRSDKVKEESRLRTLEHEREASLVNTKQQIKQTSDRLERLRQTELQLTNAIASLDADRRRTESARPVTARPSSSIKTNDYGRLDWPVDGPLVYTFGKAQTASNTTIRWDGVGIRASVGTAVRVVAPGRVVSVGQLGTYGLTVIVDHGGGDYSIYGSLARADVRPQQTVAKGDAVGTVGISDPDIPPHLHFEIRHGTDGRPIAVDPAKWLKDRP
jgi:septal ring factor EnvC (AmiA/AmiB activator)